MMERATGTSDLKRLMLRAVWRPPRGFAYWSEVNNTSVGVWYVVAGFCFFLAGGVMALLMRLQLAVPANDLIGPDAYNQLFTMHGTTMMFLFAVPILEGIGVYIVPQLLAARDLPFPRLSSYGFWCYVFGGILVLSSFFLGGAPDAGWFMYTPLSSQPFSPGKGADFWLLGLTFVEISALSAAVELTVGILKFRAPGMTLARMPVLAWAYLVIAWMIVFAFPPLLVGDLLLEAERSLGTPFFDPTRGGDPILWQHLFWFFGHPEVYIIFLPAAGMVSTILPTFARRPLVAQNWVIAATIATGVISFALWVHHMFAVGLPHTSMSMFSAASMAVAIPSGIQVFAWAATLWGTRPVLKAPMLFVLGFLFIFVLGGLTGVMVASVPFDWQVHDSHFVVAHFHYVLIGGMVFPLFAALYYWYPHVTGRLMSERLARWSFGLMFVGFNVTFFPLHILGLLGMPRRVYTYVPGLGLDGLNLIATVGAFVMAVGILVFVVDAVRSAGQGAKAASNPWNAGTLEWMGPMPQPSTGPASVPTVSTRYPVWDEPHAVAAAEQGRGYLPRATTGGRETLRIGVLSSQPEQVVALPGPSWLPVVSAAFTGVLFVGLLYYNTLATGMALAGLAISLSVWIWSCDVRPEAGSVDVGRGVRLPTYGSDVGSHAWWGGMITLAISASAFLALASAYLFLWLVSAAWPPEQHRELLPYSGMGLLAASLVAIAVIAELGRRALAGRSKWLTAVGYAASSLGAAAVIARGGDFLLGLAATSHAYVATIGALAAYVAAHLVVAATLSVLAVMRLAAGLVTAERRILVDLTALAWAYTSVIGLLTLSLLAVGQGFG